MKHFYKLLLLFSVLTLTSCTTILHRKQQKVNVFSNAENAAITVNDSVVAKTNQYGNFEVKASDSFVAYIYAEGYEMFEGEMQNAGY